MLRDVQNLAASWFDRAAGAAIFHRSARSRARSRSESLGHAERLDRLREIQALYDRPEHYDLDGGFFAAPGRIAPRSVPVRRMRGGQVADWYWPSAFELLCRDVADRYASHETNATAAARVFLHDGAPRPAVLLLHGYRAGQWAIEERVWPVEWLFRGGLDVVLPVLPFHAVRARPRSGPMFPGSDPRITNEGFRQAVLDLRELIGHLLDRGAPAAGAMGMSLGGYTTGLLATVERRLGFAVPIIPLASIAQMAQDLGRLTGPPSEQRAQLEALEAAYRAVSPLSRPALLDPSRMLVMGAKGDGITPIEHARRLADHLKAPMRALDGGHLLQLWRGDAFHAAGRMLERLGLFRE